jgi:hypothetical protein
VAFPVTPAPPHAATLLPRLPPKKHVQVSDPLAEVSVTVGTTLAAVVPVGNVTST